MYVVRMGSSSTKSCPFVLALYDIYSDCRNDFYNGVSAIYLLSQLVRSVFCVYRNGYCDPCLRGNLRTWVFFDQCRLVSDFADCRYLSKT